MNYDLLGLIIEATSGQSYAAYVQEHIFGPLDMRHSYWPSPIRSLRLRDGGAAMNEGNTVARRARVGGHLIQAGPRQLLRTGRCR